MAGYLDNYGVQEARRERIWKKIVAWVVAAGLVALILFLVFRNYSEKRVANSFVDALRAHDYQRAYHIWGCSPEAPCRDYSMQKFMEDWGPNGLYRNAADIQFTIVDACGDGVVLTVQYPNAEPFGLWVDRSTKQLGFAPWPRCPGRHLHLWEFLKSRFS